VGIEDHVRRFESEALQRASAARDEVHSSAVRKAEAEDLLANLAQEAFSLVRERTLGKAIEVTVRSRKVPSMISDMLGASSLAVETGRIVWPIPDRHGWLGGSRPGFLDTGDFVSIRSLHSHEFPGPWGYSDSVCKRVRRAISDCGCLTAVHPVVPLKAFANPQFGELARPTFFLGKDGQLKWGTRDSANPADLVLGQWIGEAQPCQPWNAR